MLISMMPVRLQHTSSIPSAHAQHRCGPRTTKAGKIPSLTRPEPIVLLNKSCLTIMNIIDATKAITVIVNTHPH